MQSSVLNVAGSLKCVRAEKGLLDLVTGESR